MEQEVRQIIQKINEDAQTHGAERFELIKKEIDDEINRENNFYRDEIKKRKDSLTRHNEHEYARLVERIEGRLRLELLAYQNDLLNEIFEEALEKLKNISDKEFSDMFKNAVKGLKGSYELVPGEFSSGRFDKNLIDESLKFTQGLDIKLSSGCIGKKSGFVLRNDIMEYNCLFEDLTKEKKEGLAAEILKEVFLN